MFKMMPISFEDVVAGARRLIVTGLEACVGPLAGVVDARDLLPGKMLRTRLGARLVVRGVGAGDLETVQHACAAIELAHTASLCHDDVMDNALLRRAQPALWRSAGASGAILVGDGLLCEAMELILLGGRGRNIRAFVAKVREVVAAETEQELLWRGGPVDEDTCLRLARGKTGPPFAFVAQTCGGRDAKLSAALAESGYRLGTAYQLADDLLDVTGDERAAGKTLGTDAARGKFTLPQDDGPGGRRTRRRVAELCGGALSCLQAHPQAREAVVDFLREDFQPVLSRHLDVCKELAV